MTDTQRFPDRVLGFYDRPFWEHLEQGALKLQRCDACGAFRYPPGPVCHDCLSPDATWAEVSGGGEVLSYAVFHKGYLPGFETPYAVVAIRLDEGPIMVSNIISDQEPARDWIGRRVEVELVPRGDAYVLPRFRFSA